MKRTAWIVALIQILSLAAPALAKDLLNETRLATTYYGADAAWYENNIPFFESSDPTLDAVYYYRWQITRAHQRDLGVRGYISTEFLEDVSWQLFPYASLNDATGFHVYEGRWLRDRRYTKDYIDYMTSGGNERHFSEYIADAVYARFLVDGDLPYAASKLSLLKKTYADWDDHFDRSKGLYWIMPLADATEYTISSIDASGGKDGFAGGEAFRPSINTYMFANARAISRLSALSGDLTAASDFSQKATTLQQTMLEALWSPQFNHFIDRYKANNAFVKYWEPIRGRELVGYLPWAFAMVPPEARYETAWSYLLSPDGLAGPAGLRTVGPSYEYYMRQYRYDWQTKLRECQWNGPVWPFQTTQALMAMQNLLNDERQRAVTRSDYLRLLRQYAKMHYQNGRLDLEEDYDPATGKPIVGLPRSHHYFHSGFDDLVITGLVGIRPREDDVLEVNPLIPVNPADPQALRSFALQSVPYHGHLIGVVFDGDGKKYGLGVGLTILVDGAIAVHSDSLKRITLPLARKAPAPIEVRLNLAMNLYATGFPHGNASINADAPSLYKALDGRVWFFPEMPHGWSTQGGQGAQWYAVDFGKPVSTHSAELAFAADDIRTIAPQSVRVQIWNGTAWRDVGRVKPLANGVTKLSWTPRPTQQLRLLFTVPKGKIVRLVQAKVF